MREYEKYKVIDLPWLNAVPSHWDMVRKKAFLTESKETVGEAYAEFDLLSLTKRGVIIRDISTGKGKFPKNFGTYKVVKPGQVIFCLFDVEETPRTVGLSRNHGMITGAYNIFSISGINSEYLHYYYIALDNVKALQPLYTGLRKVINVSTLLQTKIPVPPREEQDQIVRFLDWKVSEANHFIRSKRKEIKLLEELKKSVIFKIVSYGLNPNADMKPCELTWGENIPVTWDEVKLKRILTKLQRPYSLEDEMLICSNNGTVFPRGDKRIGLVAVDDNGCQGVQEGDLLIHGMDTWHGAIAISGHNGKCTKVVHVCDSTENKRFIAYYLRMLAFRKLYKAISNGVRQNTSDFRSWSKAGDIVIALPPRNEQDAIANYLDEQCGKIDALIAALNRQIELITEYRSRMISDLVTGKVDVRGVEVPLLEPEDADELVDEEGEDGEELDYTEEEEVADDASNRYS